MGGGGLSTRRHGTIYAAYAWYTRRDYCPWAPELPWRTRRVQRLNQTGKTLLGWSNFPWMFWHVSGISNVTMPGFHKHVQIMATMPLFYIPSGPGTKQKSPLLDQAVADDWVAVKEFILNHDSGDNSTDPYWS